MKCEVAEMLLYRRILRIPRTERVGSKKVLKKIAIERTLIFKIKKKE